MVATMAPSALSRLQRAEALLVVIDVQERLLPVIHGGEALVRNLDKLVRGFHLFDMPVVVTEQYVKGLGPSVPELRTSLTETVGYSPIEKLTFSAYLCGEFQMAMRLARRKQVIVAGIETHVCVYQTVKDLLDAEYQVTIIGDAVSSRSAENRDIALQRMVTDGARLSSTEMALFELTMKSGTDEFRSIAKLVK
jgi:nicotinamidase-related amidase